MSFEGENIEPFDWFKRFLGGSSSRARGQFGFGDMFRGFDQMRREMERQFEEQFKDIENIAPKDLVREYETPEGGKVREVGPIVYGYSMTIGPDGKPKVREFGNVRSSSPLRGGGGGSSFARPLISSEREPLADVTTTDKEVKVIVEMPGVNKENIRVNAYNNSVEITTDKEKRKYREVVEIPPETDIETATSTYKNGILEITFKKKEQAKPKGKQIRIE
ncbi:MAG TPA: archaeal heat shock protein Hsp20 [Nitrososphaeraceae archaeon]|nr:archaeal heat shock protein Hsp20 [Nitrososphaeraceae archaeon]